MAIHPATLHAPGAAEHPSAHDQQLVSSPPTSSPPTQLIAPSVTLTIPLDGAKTASEDGATRMKNMRRDSLKRRDDLLKGKEGSRRRQRWENNNLLSNPHAVAPEPRDWLPLPQYPVRHVHYEVAALWDARMEARAAVRYARGHRARPNSTEDLTKQKIPKQLKDRLKKSLAAKALLRNIEEDIRHFAIGVVDRHDQEQQNKQQAEGLVNLDSSDDELVFVSRNARAVDNGKPAPPSPKREKPNKRGSRSAVSGAAEPAAQAMAMLSLEDESKLYVKQVFESSVEDPSASFGRWLVHCIATYYGLCSYSRTIDGNPVRRVAYVGTIDDCGRESGKLVKMTKQVHSKKVENQGVSVLLPRPLHALV